MFFIFSSGSIPEFRPSIFGGSWTFSKQFTPVDDIIRIAKGCWDLFRIFCWRRRLLRPVFWCYLSGSYRNLFGLWEYETGKQQPLDRKIGYLQQSQWKWVKKHEFIFWTWQLAKLYLQFVAIKNFIFQDEEWKTEDFVWIWKTFIWDNQFDFSY